MRWGRGRTPARARGPHRRPRPPPFPNSPRPAPRSIATFKWRTLTSEDFAAFVRAQLPAAAARVELAAWLDGPGVPPGAPEPRSARLDAVAALGAALPAEGVAWAPAEWVLYLERLPRPAPAALCAALDERFHLTAGRNLEVCVTWLQVALHAGHAAALPRAEAVLASVGRMKYLKPLYRALADRPETRERARAVFAASQTGYHNIARQVIEPVVR